MSKALTHAKPSVQKLVDTFLAGRNANTREAYRLDLTDFKDYLGETSIQSSITKLLQAGQTGANLLVLEYRNALVERGLQSNTINRRLSSIRAALKLARMLGIIVWGIEVPNLKSELSRDTRGVGTSGIDAILGELRRRKHPKAFRDMAIIRLFYDLGLRVSELVGLDLDDLDLKASEIRVLGKGRTKKERLTLPEPTVHALKRWLAVRPEGATQAVFTNFDRAKKGDGRITRFGVYKVVRWLGEQVNLKTRPHGIRHDALTAAVKLAQEHGIELPSVLKFSRHKDLATLMVYLDLIQNRQGEIAALVAGNLGKRKRKPL